MLKVEKLKVHGLPPLSFEVPAGECLAVAGPSGSGKSLLLRAIADLDPTDGHVFLDGAERNEMPAPTWRRDVRFIAAEPGWWGKTPADHFADRDDALAMMPGLGLEHKLLDQEITLLSTGERQRFAILRALVDGPKVLLFDEPTSALDAQSAALVEALIKGLMLEGRHVLLVSHDQALSKRLAHAHLLLGDVRNAPAPAGSRTSGPPASGSGSGHDGSADGKASVGATPARQRRKATTRRPGTAS